MIQIVKESIIIAHACNQRHIYKEMYILMTFYAFTRLFTAFSLSCNHNKQVHDTFHELQVMSPTEFPSHFPPTDKDQKALGWRPMTDPSSILLGTYNYLSKCRIRASDAGGTPSSDQSFLSKRSFLHSSRVNIVLAQSCSSTTNLSINAE